jgi:hypothetical protein
MAAKNIVVIRQRNAHNAADEFWQGAPVAVITDARDIGVQLYANDGGSMFFTLPVDHPVLPLIDPLNQHYVVQRWNGSSYDTIQSGFITDYDASANEVVINGVDYMTTLNKYYTPIHGPELGAKAIPNTDTTAILSTTPSAIIAAAVSKDRAKASEGYAVSSTDSTYKNVGKISAYSGAAQSSTNPSGTRDAITVEYEEVSGVKTGTVILSGALYIWRDSAANKFQEGETGKLIEGNFSIGTSSSAKGKIGFIISSNPGGPLAKVEFDVYIAVGTLDIGFTSGGYGALNFNVKLRPVSNYASGTEDHTGTDLNRVMSILSEGVSYEFYITPYYYGNLSPSDATADFDQYIWGPTTRAPESTFTAGLQTNTIRDAYDDLLDPADPANVLDRSKDYPPLVVTPVEVQHNTGDPTQTVYSATPFSSNFAVGDQVVVSGAGSGNGTFTIVSFSANRLIMYIGFTADDDYVYSTATLTKNFDCKPLIQFMSIEHLGTNTTTKHPYVTAGQGTVDFMRDLADIEMGSRSTGEKVVFNFYGVPSASPDGKKLSVHHSVSSNPQATIIYPGQILDYNVTNKRSAKVTSARVIPTTDFLIGSSTEGSGGSKTKGAVKVAPGITSSSPALPTVTSQGGFLSADAAGNFAQGIINDFGEDADIQMIKVSLRTEQFGPIGVAGTPKLGETVRVVVRRKNVTVGGDELSGLYNVGGMQWLAKVDGTERLALDLVKPNKFKGAAITWERKPNPKPEPTNDTRTQPGTPPPPKPPTTPTPPNPGPSGTAAPGVPRIAGRVERFQL